MSWFRRCKDAVAKWGTEPAKFLLKTVLPAAIPGSGLVVDVAERVLSLVGGGADEGDFMEVASESELNTVGRILAEFDDRLAHLAEQLLERQDDSPEKLARLVWQEMKKDKDLADALRDIAGMVSRFDRIDEAQRELLRKVGYGNDLQETMLGVARRQEVLILDFVQDQQMAKGQLRELADNVSKLNLAIAELVSRPADALPKLRQLEVEQPNSAAVREAVAVGAALTFDLDLTTSSLERAVQLRPDDKPLAELCREVTIKTRGIGGDSSRKPPKPADADAGFRPGDTLDGWKLLSLLGKGGFGQVFKAERNGVVRALKVLLPALITDPHFEANFKREILTLCNLGRHPHIVQFDEFGYDKPTGSWYFTMEYIEGESLQTRLMKGALPPTEAVRLFTLLSGPGGLATVHEKGVVHRDIKPANILLLPDGTPKLVDFGVAVQVQRGEETKSGGHTVMFASPEQLRGFHADKPSDVYSLVGSLWYAITKQEPGLFRLATFPPALDPLRKLMLSAFHYWPEDRHADSGVVHALLKEVDPAKLPRSLQTAVPFAPEVVFLKHQRVKMPAFPPGRNVKKTRIGVPISESVKKVMGWLGGAGTQPKSFFSSAVAPADAPARWSPFGSTYCPRPRVELTCSRDGIAYPGELIWLHMSLVNDSRNTLKQLKAQLESNIAVLHELEIDFGEVRPADRVDRCVGIVLPADTKPGQLVGELRFQEENGCVPHPQGFCYAVEPLPRPDFPTDYFLEAEVNGRPPERRTTCRRKEFLDVVVTATNRTGDDLPELELVLTAVKVPAGVRVTGDRWKLGSLNHDTAAEGRLSFTVDANAQLGPATFEVRVVSGDDRTFAVIPVETSVG